MPLLFVRNDITEMDADIIVNSTGSEPSFGFGIDHVIYSKGGSDLVNARKDIGFIDVTKAKYTQGYNLKSKYVIHTVGPYWHGYHNETELELKQTYANCLHIAEDLNASTIAFPLISSGVNGLPKIIAFEVAVKVLNEYLQNRFKEDDLTIYLVLFDKESYNVAKEKENVKAYIDTYVVSRQYQKNQTMLELNQLFLLNDRIQSHKRDLKVIHKSVFREAVDEAVFPELNDDFRTTLFRLILQSGMTDAQVYKKANITRTTFNKIRNKPDYNPSKMIILALCCALELPLNETNSLLRTQGIVLSDSIKFDVIVKYFISKREYNIMTINQYLYEYDQKLLGSQ